MSAQLLKLTDEEYFASPRISCSDLKELLAAPAKFRFAKDNPSVRRETPDMRFGKLFHQAVLEPAEFAQKTALWDAANGSTRTKAYAEFYDKMSQQGKKVLDRDEAYQIDAMITSIRKHKFVADALDHSKSLKEQTLFWTNKEFDVDCRAKIDLINPEMKLILDIKTTSDASPDGFGKSVVNYKYDLQALWYLMGAKEYFNESFQFIFLAVEKNPPYLFTLQYATFDDMVFAAEMAKTALERYVKSKAVDFWEGYPSEIIPVKRPAWASKKDET